MVRLFCLGVIVGITFLVFSLWAPNVRAGAPIPG